MAGLREGGGEMGGGSSHPRRGVALIVALGVLVVLSLLGTVFATMTGIERNVARNYLDKVRARLLAESGVEHAVAELSRPDGMDIWRLDVNPSWTYYGGDLNANGKKDVGDVDKDGDGIPDTNSLPVSEALRPSFALDANQDGLPDQVKVGSNTIGISGSMQLSTYGTAKDVYSVRVIDLGSKLNVNSVHPHLADPVTGNGILCSLFQALKVPDPSGTALALIKGRPAGGFRDTTEIASVVGDAKYRQIRPFVTVFGWMDPKELKAPQRIARPVPLDNGFRRHSFPSAWKGTDVMAYWELRPTGKTYREDKVNGIIYDQPNVGHGPRTPVNINTAPVEVLVAVLNGLKGFYVQEDPYSTTPYDWYSLHAVYDRSLTARRGGPPLSKYLSQGRFLNGRVGTLYETTPLTADFGYRTGPAWAIARRIIEERSKDFVAPPGFVYTGKGVAKAKNLFRSFQQFNAFIDALPASDFAPIPPAEIPMVKDVLKANFNPNFHLNELNPDELIAYHVDKTDLTYHTFEFTFFPMGYFEIQSAGWVLDPKDEIVAEEIVTSDVKVFDCHRDTTQWDFLRGWGENGEALTDVFSPRTSPEVTANNVSLHSYPEFEDKRILVPPNAGPNPPAPGADGYLALNTIRPGKRGSAFSLSFDNQGRDTGPFKTLFDPTNGVGVCTPERNGAGAFLGPWPDSLLGNVLGTGQPGSLVNDGILCEMQASPGYDNANFNQHKGAISMWVKPIFRPENAGRNRLFLSLIYNNDGSEANVSPFLTEDKLARWESIFGVFFIANQFSAAPPANWHNFSETMSPVYGNMTTTWGERILGAGFGGRREQRSAKFGPPVPAGDDVTLIEEPVCGQVTGTVNHVGHGHGTLNGWDSVCQAHRWVHIGFYWDDSLNPGTGVAAMRVNGRTGLNYYSPSQDRDDSDDAMPGDEDRRSTRWGPGGDPSPHPGNEILGIPPLIRLGAESDPPIPPYAWFNPATWWTALNYTADATIDEVQIWQLGNASLTKLDGAFRDGRYYKESDATFTSPKVSFLDTKPRLLPPPGTAVAPAGVSTGVVGSGTSALAPAPVRLGIFAYTGYWPVKTPNDPAKQDLSATTFSVGVLASDRSTLMALQEARLGGTAVKNASGGPVAVSATDFRYQVRMDPKLGDPLNTPLLFSPILDDVTITYYNGPAAFLSWRMTED